VQLALQAEAPKAISLVRTSLRSFDGAAGQPPSRCWSDVPRFDRPAGCAAGLTHVVSLSPKAVGDVRVLFEYGGSALQGGLKFRERQDVDEVLRLLLPEVARNPVR
jgi:hypothetical protein